MAEYGNAIVTQGPEELQPDALLAVHKILDYNFKKSREKLLAEAGVDLGHGWQFKVGSMTPAHEWIPCSACEGRGTRWSGCGCGRGVSHVVDCGTRPPMCGECDGAGGMPGAVIPGQFEHTFAWYVDTDAVTNLVGG